MYWIHALAGASMLAGAQAHIAMWNKGLYGYNYPGQATDEKQNWNGNNPVNPHRQSDNQTVEEWFGHGHKDYPPAPGDFMELPAGGTYIGDLACNRAFSGTMRAPVYKKAPNEFACTSEGPLHTTNRFNKPTNVTALGGTAIGIAYTSDVHSVQPNDMTIISVNHASPWKREVAYDIPKGMPSCPEDGCICSWNWLHRGGQNGGEGYPWEIYNNLYRCKIVGDTDDSNEVLKGQVAKDCTGKPDQCVTGPKTGLYIYQKTGNNIEQPNSALLPSYSMDWGFADGAQNDALQKRTGSTDKESGALHGVSGVSPVAAMLIPAVLSLGWATIHHVF